MPRRYLMLLLTLTIVFVLYHPVLTTYFSQDDFFHFKVSQTDGSLNGFAYFFGFHPFSERGIAFYRPIFRESLYSLFYSFFGLNPLPFRILEFIIHFSNIVLVFFLIQKLFRSYNLSLFVAFFFGLTAANVSVLYYLAGGIQALGATLFVLCSVTFYLKFLEQRRNIFKLCSLVFFLLGLASHELAITTPMLLTILVWAYRPFNRLPINIIGLWPYFVFSLLYLYFDFFVIGFSQAEKQYQVVLSLKAVLNSFAWYTSWALGLPEMLIDFVLPGLKLNPDLMRYWGNYFTIIFLSAALSLIILFTLLAYIFLKSKECLFNKKLLFLLFWFPVAIAPVILLPFHKSAYYLPTALVGFWGAIGFLIFSFYSKVKLVNFKVANLILTVFLCSLTVLSLTSIQLGNNNYWAASRGRLAKQLIDQVKGTYPKLPKGSAIYLTNDPNYPFVAKEWGGSSKQAAFILNKEDALQLLYHDSTLRVFYQDLGGIPFGFPIEKVHSLVAKINN